MNFQNSNEIIKNYLIQHEYIKNHVYSIEHSCKGLFIYLSSENMDCQTCHYSNKLLVIIIDFVIEHARSYFSSFIHIMYAIL
jgi:hypothetical protein